VTTKGMARLDVVSCNTNESDDWKWNKLGMWIFENKRREVQTYGCKQVYNKWIGFGTHFNEGLKHKSMHFFSSPKWLYCFWHHHWRPIIPIVDYILFWDINIFLQKFLKWRGKLKGSLSERCVMKLLHHESQVRVYKIAKWQKSGHDNWKQHKGTKQKIGNSKTLMEESLLLARERIHNCPFHPNL